MNENKPNKIEDFAAKLISLTDPSRVYRLRRKPSPNEIVYGGFNDRVFASVIDVSLCLLLFYQPMHYIAAMLFGQERAHQLYSLTGFTMTAEQQVAMINAPGYMEAYLLNCLLQAVILGALFVVMWSNSSATPGKFLLRMRIVDERTGKRPGQKQFIVRFIGAIIGSLPLMLGFVWIIFDKKKRGWHDKIAGTVVVRVKHWRITAPDVSEYPEAVLAAMAAEEAWEEEAEEEDGFAVVQAPPEEDKVSEDSGKGGA